MNSVGKTKLLCAALAALVSLGFGKLSQAQLVTADLTGLTPFSGGMLSLDGHNVDGDGVGQLSWDGSPYPSNPAPFNSTFNTYCLDLNDSISVGQTFTFDLDTDLATAPKPSAGGPMGTNAAREMQALYGEHFNPNGSDDDLQAFQLAVWGIVYNGFGNVSVTDTSDHFFVENGIDSNALALANNWLQQAFVSADTDTGTFNDNVVALIGQTIPGTDSSVQDQVVIGIIPTTSVPEINASGFVSLLLVLCGAFALLEGADQTRLLRRRPIAAASH